MPEGGGTITREQVVDLLDRVNKAGLEFVKIESLYNFSDKPGYSLGQGQ